MRSPTASRGRPLIYVGAGSSGRIAALDASECESTFSVPPETVVSLVAGGASAPPLEQEAAEDDRAAGAKDLVALAVGDRRHRRRHQRQWEDALRAQCDRRGRTSRRSHGLRRLRAGSELEKLVDHPDRRRRRPGVPRGFDPTQGRDRAEARLEHALDRFDDPARQDLRQPHGRRLGDEREAARTRQAHRGHGDRRLPGQVEHALSAAEGDAKVAIVSLLAEIDSDEARAKLDAAGQSIRLALRA